MILWPKKRGKEKRYVLAPLACEMLLLFCPERLIFMFLRKFRLDSDVFSSSQFAMRHDMPHAFDTSEIKNARDKIIARNNNYAANAYNYNDTNGTNKSPRRSWGSSTVYIVNGRRSSDSSDNSIKINGYVRPSQPPPAPPSSVSSLGYERMRFCFCFLCALHVSSRHIHVRSLTPWIVQV